MIIRWSRADRVRMLGATGLGVLAGLCGVGLLLVSAWLLSRAAEHPPVLYLMTAIVWVRAFGLGRAVFRYLERLVGHDLALRLQGDLRRRTYAALARSTWWGRRGGDVLTRVITDVSASQDLVVRAVLPIASAAVVISVTTAMIMVLLPAAGLVVLAAVVVAGAVVPVIAGRRAARTERDLAPLRGRLAAVVSETDRAATDLLLADATELALDRVRTVDQELRRAERRSAFWVGAAGTGQLVATGAAVIGAAWAGATALVEGALPPVQLAVLVLAPLALHEVLATVPAAIQAWSRSWSSLRRVGEVLGARPVGAGETPAATASTAGSRVAGLIELSAVTAGWPGVEPVVHDLDLVVRAGERVALVGPSGVGKTTVAATLLGLLEPVAGSVRIRGSVGCLAQDAYVFDTTVAENVRLGRGDATDAEIAAALVGARLDLPMDRRVGANGNRLSGGEQRRLALTRLLLRDDPVLILDEPTEHLDRSTAAALVDDLWARTTDRAVLVITHDRELIQRCDRSIRLDPPLRTAERAVPGDRKPCSMCDPREGCDLVFSSTVSR